MLNAVLDVDILISATLWKGNSYQILHAAKEGKVQLTTSLEILQEFIEVISRPKFGLTQQQVEGAVKQIITISAIIEPAMKIHPSRDSDDDKFLACGASGKGDYIVSEDNDILVLRNQFPIPIISAKEMIPILKNEYPEGL